jgi:hypothetical protein
VDFSKRFFADFRDCNSIYQCIQSAQAISVHDAALPVTSYMDVAGQYFQVFQKVLERSDGLLVGV